MNKFILLSLVSLCCLLSLNNCHSQSEIDYRLIPSDCEYELTAFLAGAGPNYSAFYDWGDGTTSFASWAYVEHVYDGPGIYTVTAIHDGITYVDDVSIEDCGCPVAFENIQVSNQCNSVSAQLDTYLYSNNAYSVEWNWGDGESTTSGYYPTGYHTYAAEGFYDISATFTGPGCEDGVTLSTGIDIEFCEGECYPYFDYYYEEESCSFSWFNETAPEYTVWTIDGEFVAEGSWVSGQQLVPGDHLLCYDISANDYCPFGQSDCLYITAPECEQNCEAAFWSTPLACQSILLELVSATEISEVTWYLESNDVIIGGNYEEFTFSEGGEHEICFSYFCENDNSLYEGCEVVFVESCEELCPEITTGYIDCLTSAFTYSGDFDGIFHQWTVLQNGTVIETFEGNSTTIIDFPNSGLYQVGVSDAYNCDGELESYYIKVEVEACDCEAEMTSLDLGCGLFDFQFDENAAFIHLFAQDTFDSGTFISLAENSNELSHVYQFTQSGVYNIIGEYWDNECETWLAINEVIWVETCQEECAEIIVFETEECGVYDFSMLGDIYGNAYCWEVWNDDYFFTYFDEETTTFTFTEAGIYYLTVTNAEFCEGQNELIYEINVPECEEQGGCIYAAGGVQNGCTTAILTVYADFEIDEVHWLLDGEIIIAGNNFEYDFESYGNQFIEIAYIPGIDCNDLLEGWEIPVFMDTSWCQEDCFLEVYSEQVEDGVFLFSTDASDPEASTSWLVNGQYFDGETLTYEFLEPGVHEVCAFYETPDCPFGVEDCIDVTVAPGECPEITYELTENCNTVIFTFDGLIDGPWYCWDVIGDGYYTTYFDGQTSSVTFPGPGTYQVGVTNALLCDDLEEYLITVIIPECENECEGVIEVLSQDCNEVLFLFPDSASNIYIDFGDSSFEEGLSNNIHDHYYELPGSYEVCAEYFDSTCGYYVGVCVAIEIEDCEINCEYEVEIESLGNNTYIFYASVAEEAWTNWTINGESFLGQNALTYTFEEEGVYEACFSMETEYCGVTGDCYEITVINDECEGVILSLEGLLDGNEDWLQTLDCVLSLDGDPIWEQVIDITSDENIEEMEFCLPQGCYEFSVANSDPLILGSLVFLIDALDDTEIEYELEFDPLTGSASIQFGIGMDCTTDISSVDDLSEVGFYPVPAADVLFIKQNDQIDVLEVIDTQGKLIFSSQNKTLNSVDVSSWSDGVYLFRYLENGNWHSKKIQVSH